VSSQWRRVHPLSPLLRMWAVLVGIVAVLLFQQSKLFGDAWRALSESSLPTVLIIVGVIAVFPVVFALGWLVSLPWWRATGYRISDEEIAVRRGVVSRQIRTARFDRVHAVDLVEPLAPRLFRLAGVSVETAGGSGSAVKVEYLLRSDAESLRSALLQLVNGTPQDADDHWSPLAGRPGEPVEQSASGTEIVLPIPIARSIAAAAMSGATASGLLAVFVSLTTPAGLALLVPVALGVVPWLWGVLNTSWRFTARLSGDVLGVTFGLTERRRQSVPLGRIHAVKVSQPVLWRMLGWWKVTVDIAGYGAEEGNGGSTTTLLPVGDLIQALRVFTLVAPLDANQILELAHPEGMAASELPSGGAVNYRSPASARWVSPVDRRRQGVTLVPVTDSGETAVTSTKASSAGQWQAVVSHHGRLRRVVSVIAPSHIQELSLHRGPVQQMLGLSGVRLDLVPGPVAITGRDLAAEDAVDLVNRLRGRSLPVHGAA
jgi:putative membrane protein